MPENEPEPIPINDPVNEPVVLLWPINEPENVVAVTLDALLTVNKLTDALVTVNGVLVDDTDADTCESPICVKFNPTIPDAGMLVKPPPLP